MKCINKIVKIKFSSASLAELKYFFISNIQYIKYKDIRNRMYEMIESTFDKEEEIEPVLEFDKSDIEILNLFIRFNSIGELLKKSLLLNKDSNIINVFEVIEKNFTLNMNDSEISEFNKILKVLKINKKFTNNIIKLSDNEVIDIINYYLHHSKNNIDFLDKFTNCVLK